MPIETIEPIERCLMWVADGDDEGQGTVAFGRCYLGEGTGTKFVRAEGFGGDWNITHWMPLPRRPDA